MSQMVMKEAPVTCPQKVEYVAALFQMALEHNQGISMTRREIEEVVSVYVPLDGFSESTRQRALNVLANRKVICYGWPNGSRGMTYWVPSEKEAI